MDNLFKNQYKLNMNNSAFSNFIAYIFVAIKYSAIVIFSLIALGISIIFIIGAFVLGFIFKTFFRINRFSDQKIKTNSSKQNKKNSENIKDIVDVEYEIIDDKKKD